ncbi:SidA/IucD/PvdA family monooxygenase [Streptomyces sp. NRRL B-1677]|uniref:flavin-containing monooxygenase n=1 Tax=Streptomyces sp. NRRL B-1677 TaxID=2682966 RepID=UPI001892AC46|nr:NAD(P)-binding domain-containing protein [Streptomyces sp. NRRL B-1677]MBF6047980.1 SidA/IucD/PvdA family monooxygenase [Streptomyces sp. NRRL B-1677]
MRPSVVCVIGAGPSGLAACKVLSSRGIPFECHEAGSGIGGLWRLNNDNGMSGIYESLHANISKESMAFASMPMPESYPIFPHHALVLSYLEAFAGTFSLHRNISLGAKVTSVHPHIGGGWEVMIRRKGSLTDETHHYRAVVVASGHHWDPRFPDPAVPGEELFEGSVAHAHGYRTPKPYTGKRVLVVGMGNSACEIAAEVSRAASQTILSTRRGAHVFPKFILGRPADHLATSILSDMPAFMKRPMLHMLLWLSRGRLSGYGLPKPDHALLTEHPSTSDEVLVQLARGAISVKPGLASYDRSSAVFTDGSRAPVDSVIYATGYKLSFPFLDESLFSVKNGRTDLYMRTVPVAHDGLYFMGLVQPSGAAFPLLEDQAEWIADLIDGSVVLPSQRDMARANQRLLRRHDKTYSHSYRHGIEIDYRSFRRALRRERRAGRRRQRITAPRAASVPEPAVPADAM